MQLWARELSTIYVFFQELGQVHHVSGRILQSLLAYLEAPLHGAWLQGKQKHSSQGGNYCLMAQNDHTLEMNWLLMSIGSFCSERKTNGFSETTNG